MKFISYLYTCPLLYLVPFIRHIVEERLVIFVKNIY
nr:unnamed protein product [Callosobruchus chinensis]